VTVAKSEREMKEIMRNLGKYMRKKKLVVNVEKRKMLVFHMRKRKGKKRGVELRRKHNRTSK
jgi:L-2-hydroxyglutarate oxidase LhgO